jgi:hypothetical protein
LDLADDESNIPQREHGAAWWFYGNDKKRKKKKGREMGIEAESGAMKMCYSLLQQNPCFFLVSDYVAPHCATYTYIH